jgi:hypothetical protein
MEISAIRGRHQHAETVCPSTGSIYGETGPLLAPHWTPTQLRKTGPNTSAATVDPRTKSEIARLSRIHAVLSGINATIVRGEIAGILSKLPYRSGAGRIRHGVDRRRGSGLIFAAKAAWAGLEATWMTFVSSGGCQRFTGSGHVARQASCRSNDIENDPRITFKEEALSRGYRSLVAPRYLWRSESVAVMLLYAARR